MAEWPAPGTEPAPMGEPSPAERLTAGDAAALAVPADGTADMHARSPAVHDGASEVSDAQPRAVDEVAPPGAAALPPAVPDVHPLGAAALDALLRQSRTQTRWTDQPVGDDVLRQLYDLVRWGPTSANCSPARFAFLRTPDVKERLRPALSAGNLEKTLTAPVVVVVAHDPAFYEQLPRLFPHADARAWFAGSPALAEETAFRNGTLQGAYLILAARGLGLGTCPMSGFDRERVDQILFAGSGWRSNFLVGLGHGEPAGLYPRSPRLEFDEACLLL